MRIAVLDDDREECQKLISALHGWDPTREAECFADGASLLAAAKVQPPFTVAFIDIYLPKENGVEIAGELIALSPQTDVVFVTTSREHAIDAFEVGAVHYLIKPVTTGGIRDLLPQLDERFLNVRRGYVVNMEYLANMGAESCTLRSGEEVLLSRKEHISIRETYNRWVFSRLAERR